MDPFIIVGGGIAGATCAKVLSLDNPQSQVILIAASPVVKMVANLRTIGRSIDIFDVIEQSSSALESKNLKISNNKVTSVDSANHRVTLADDTVLKYSKLCICTGAKPKSIPVHDQTATKYIKCIRDTETATDFQSGLSQSKRIVIVGNGGIATELAYKVTNCEIVWAIKDENFGATFFDKAVSKFFTSLLNKNASQGSSISKREHFTAGESEANRTHEFGAALGPDWYSGFSLIGQSQKRITIEKSCHVHKVYSNVSSIAPEKASKIVNSSDDSWNVYVELSNGQIYGCDMIICATGVTPNCELFTRNTPFAVSAEGGLLVDNEMRTNISDIYAAGDVCSAGWEISPHWFQMRLWTQARQMGFYAAKCIAAHSQSTSPALYFNFDVFTHVTNFFGFRVILLGLYNGQKLSLRDCSILYRVEPEKEFIKVILQNGTMKGAVLIGETNFEETFENLIYNQMDLSRFGDHLLDEVLDVEDFFD